MSLNDNNYSKSWYAVPISVSNPEALSGHHAEYVLYILDESAGLEEELMERIEGALSTEGSYFLSMGNPSFRHGTLFNLCTKYSHMYKVHTLSSEESPHVTKEFIDFMKEKYGEDSDVYRVRVKGEFPLEDSMKLFSPEKVKQAISRTNVKTLEDERIHFGVDVSATGGDKFVVSIVLGNKEIDRISWTGEKLNTSARRVIELAKKYKNMYDVYIKVDSTGLGIGFAEMLEEEIANFRLEDDIELECINFSRKARLNDRFSDVVTEMYFNFNMILDEVSLFEKDEGENNEIIEQFSNRGFTFDASGRWKLGNKKEFIRQYGHSPDETDAIVLAFYNPAERELVYMEGSINVGANKW